MVIRRKTRNTSLKTPLGICVMAGVSSVVLAAVVITLATPTVQADARLPGPAFTAPPSAPILSGTPTQLASKKAAAKTSFLRGLASWYGSVLNGHRTASGERFNMYAMTACHPTLPFGTQVRVTDLNTKKSVVVRINDRGVLSEGRIIDLSYAAAQELNITKAGLAPVALEVISLGRTRKKE
jgi:rare lipoprotein A